LTIGQRYNGRPNGLTTLRAALAVVIIVSHGWMLGGFGPDPIMLLTGARVDVSGTLAVFGFFGISGFLLIESRQHTSRLRFIWRRCLRILPGYWVLVTLTTILVGPRYLLDAALPFADVANLTSASFRDNPNSPLVNGSLWTLWPELLCYSAIAITSVRAGRLLVPAAIVSFPLIIIANGGDASYARLFEAFAFGAFLSLHRDRIPLSPIVVAIALGLTILTIDTVGGTVVAPIAIVYASLWAGANLKFRVTRDLSYGLYIYAFPVAQILVALGAARLGVIPYVGLTLLATWPLAFASWTFIERRALALKDLSLAVNVTPVTREVLSRGRRIA
jgi:peptidoglycan/LPS O-acetylase OafA/YrhL